MSGSETPRQTIYRSSRHVGCCLILFCASIAALCVSPASAKFTVAVHDPQTGKRLGEAHPSTLIVQFSSAATSSERAAAHQALGAVEHRYLGAPGLYSVNLPPHVTPDMALKYYASASVVRGAYPNSMYYVFKAPNDPLVSQQFALSQMSAFSGWEYEVGASSPVTVAVMDTGVDKTHPDLIAGGKYDTARSQDFCNASLVPGDTCSGDYGTDVLGHGTEVAGLAAAAAENSIGIAGVSWGAKIVSLRVFTDQGSASDAEIIAALNYAATLTSTTGRRTIINMSLGECDPSDTTSCGTCDAAEVTAVNNALAAGTVLVAAAGNQGSSNPRKFVTCPAKIPGVIAVGATNIDQTIASFSAQGPEMTTQGVVAPGVNVETTMSGGGYGSNGVIGTSFSSPQVAGLAALIVSAKPAFAPAEVLTTLRSSAESLGVISSAQGAGKVNIYMALRLAVNGTLATFEGRQKAIAFPNPFRPTLNGNVTITIPVSLAGTNPSIRIYTMDGRLVRTLPGQTWDGKNDQGVPVATGTYLYLVTTSNGKTTGKLALIR